MFLPKIAFRNFLLFGWVETFVACYWYRWKVQDMTVWVVFFILKLVCKFLSDGELNTAWNREKNAMSQGFTRYWVTLVVATPACTRAPIHPLPSRRLPRDFSAAISIWSPPKKIRKWSSPCVGHLHWICLAIVYSGWSNVMTGIWPGFTVFTAALMKSMEWRIIATDLA